jgi:hypothetical protein
MKIPRIIDRRRAIGAASLFSAGAFLFPRATTAEDTLRSGEKTLASRIQRLEDIEEIRLVLTNYGRFLDAHDLVAYSNQFASNGEWVGGFGSGTGPSGVLALMQKNLPPPSPAGKPGSTYHLLTNFEIDVQGDTAAAWSRWTFTVTGADNKPSMMYGGHYDDTLVREEGRWKFQRRVASNDIPHADPPAK